MQTHALIPSRAGGPYRGTVPSSALAPPRADEWRRAPNRLAAGRGSLYRCPCSPRTESARGTIRPVDTRTPEQRRRIMQSVKSENTGPELAVRRLLHGMGYRYRLHRRDLPGRPDIAFVSRRKAIFVHGCFWHGHGCSKGRLPKSRLDYWQPKVDKNRERDRTKEEQLKSLGWSGIAVPDQRRVALRPCARVEPRPADVERPHRAHRYFAAALPRDRAGHDGTDQPVLQALGKRRLQHAAGRHRRRARRVHQPEADPLPPRPLRDRARDGPAARLPRLVPP